jgi:hypothetical protein
MRAPAKPNGKPSRKSVRPPRDQRRLVEQLTAAGLNADIVSQILNVNKNKLRREHAVALYSGRKEAERQKAAKAKANVLSREEKHAADAVLSATSSHWQTELGNLIFDGLDGSGAKTAADAYAKWLRDGGRWNCSGLATNFSDERVAEFARLKAEALQLLKRLNISDGD